MKTRARSIQILVLVLLTGLAYCRLTNNEFIKSYDDGLYVLRNSHVHGGLTLQGISWAFTTTRASNWHPLTWISHMLDWQIYGSNAAGHHLTNLLLHVANSVLLFLLLSALTNRSNRSFFVAALFAIHPLHVESVAWIAERKDVLSTFFCFLTIAAYMHYLRRPSGRRYLLIISAFALGLLSKPMLVSLPLILLLLDYWPLRRFSMTADKQHKAVPARRLFLEKLPLFALAAGSCIVTFWAQSSGGSVGSLHTFGIGSRLANAAVSSVSYILKTIWPRYLSVFYPYPLHPLPIWQVGGSALLLISAVIAAVRYARSKPYVTVGVLWYAITLLPVIGLVQVGVQAMADRYTYLPLIGPFIILAWAIPDLIAKFDRHADRFRLPAISVACLVLVALTARTFAEVGYWRNGETLFRRATYATSGNILAHCNLAHELAWRGRWSAAAREYKEALKLAPRERDSRVSLGSALVKMGRYTEARKWLRPMLGKGYRESEVCEGMAASLAGQGRVAESVKFYQLAINKAPRNAHLHSSLGVLYMRMGRSNAAVRELEQAAEIDPENAAIHHNLGLIYQRQRRLDLALDEYRTAAALAPNNPEHHQTLAIILYTVGDYPASWAELQAVERLGAQPNPDLVKTLQEIQRQGR